MKNVTYTSTENVVEMKKSLRKLKEMKSKFGKLIKRGEEMLISARKSEKSLIEFQLGVNKDLLFTIDDRIKSYQLNIQHLRQDQFNKAKEYSIAQGLSIDVVKGNMKAYNQRRLNKEVE